MKAGLVPEARKLTYSSQQMSFGDPVRVELTASSDETLDAVVAEVEAAAPCQLTGVFDVKNDRDTGKREIGFTLKPEARTYGLTPQSLPRLPGESCIFGDESLRVQRATEDAFISDCHTRSAIPSMTLKLSNQDPGGFCSTG